MRLVASIARAAWRFNRHAKGRARLRRDSGQSLIEFALVSLAMVALMLGVIDVGRFAYIGILVGNAARAGAAYGAANPGDTPGIWTAACNDFLANVTTGKTTTPTNLGAVPKPTCDDTSGSKGDNHLYVNWPSSQSDFASCGCDSSGTYTPTFYGATACAVTQSYMATNCGASGDHWSGEVSVEASGSFKALFLPTSVTFDRTATVRVP